ncbi:GNAT family N-acetyltransferase [Vibrio hepatarius]|uniref:GNAT family N-acetyltransferase n=1 Tax=Vibrio hepatarius TaxID=171383 RepID=UPI001C094E76|nr:GNAT family N-acetyltransferase [Vibrio hepatarius]MBU2898134.1 GNAT family N-acetyltransferase [Vibrio hepatarius]
MAGNILENNISVDKFYIFQSNEVNKITITDEQVQYAGTAKGFLVGGNDTTYLHVIKNNDIIIGFFKIDTAYSGSFSFCPNNGLGLKAFAIDINFQGKGIGTQVVKELLPYLETNYPEYKSVYLTVNCKNPAAKSCYQKGGFSDTEELYLGGDAGPQHIMYAKLENK